MRCVLFVVALMFATPAFAQEEGAGEPTYVAEIHSVRPSPSVEQAIEAFRLRGGPEPVIGRADTIAPRVCRRREFPIPFNHSLHPGMLLRIEDGECPFTHIYYVHNPTRTVRRIHIIEEWEALQILQTLPSTVPTSAPP